MNESQIRNLFLQVTGSSKDVPDDVKHVFNILMDSTLDYRDQIKEKYSIILTVEDVRIALNWLSEVMRSGSLPETNHGIRRDLLAMWLDKLNMI